MAESRVNFTITNADVNLIELDPDIDGYIKMFLDRVDTRPVSIQWSSTNEFEEITARLPFETSIFDYNIYVKCLSASVEEPVVLAITRV